MSGLVLATLVTLAACGADEIVPDASAYDARVDPGPDAARCSGAQEFTGELIDVDSAPLDFHGVVGAVLARRDEPTCTATTAPNGRFVLTVASSPVVFDVDAPSDYLDGIWPIEGAMAGTATFSARAFSDADLTALGVTRDPTRAQILLYQNAPLGEVPLTVSGDQGPTFTTADGTSWVAGNDRAYILFTNVAIDRGVVSIGDATGNAVPVGEPRVEAGKVTYLTTVQLPE